MPLDRRAWIAPRILKLRRQRGVATDKRLRGRERFFRARREIRVGAIPRWSGFHSASWKLKMAHVVDLLEIAGVESDDFVGDDAGDDAINKSRHPLREGVEFARAFFLI